MLGDENPQGFYGYGHRVEMARPEGTRVELLPKLDHWTVSAPTDEYPAGSGAAEQTDGSPWSSGRIRPGFGDTGPRRARRGSWFIGQGGETSSGSRTGPRPPCTGIKIETGTTRGDWFPRPQNLDGWDGRWRLGKSCCGRRHRTLRLRFGKNRGEDDGQGTDGGAEVVVEGRGEGDSTNDMGNGPDRIGESCGASLIYGGPPTSTRAPVQRGLLEVGAYRHTG